MLKLSNISKSFNGKTVFDSIDFILNDNEKLGLIGRNGSGKSTILKIIAGKLQQDSGTIVTSKNYRIGYLEQHLIFKEKTILDEVCMALPDYKKDNFWEGEKLLQDIGFSPENLQKSPMEFSGGWQIRLNLAKLLISELDLLLLDEPTNYLDIVSIRWLKRFLRDWKKSFILITHDRFFMNDVITHTLIIHRNVSKKIIGNVDDMYEQISEEEETYEKTRVNENKKCEQIQDFIDRFRFKATKAKQVQSKIKMLNKQEEKEKLQAIQNLDFDFSYKDIITNRPFIEVKDLNFGYVLDKILIKNFNFKVEKYDRICVIGKNGKGKSTLLKLLIGEIQSNSGIININPKVEIGYFGQMNINRLNPNSSVEEELWNTDRTIPRSKILSTAGIMMFSGDDHRKKINVLSGGEKSRVLLAKIILKQCNLLLLDEPTNHLDMESCISLMEAISNFQGASITITHNEDYLSNVANKLIVFDDDKVFLFEGSYKNFLNEIGWSNEDIYENKTNKFKKLNIDISNSKNYTNKKIKNYKDKLEKEIFDLELLIEEMVSDGKYSEISDIQKKLDKKNDEYNSIICEKALDNLKKPLTNI